MWRRLACSPYISDEERHAFAIRAATVARTDLAPRLNEAIQRELDARQSGAQLVTTLPPHAPQQRLDREEWEQLTARRPPGECVAHSVNAAAHITAAAEPLTASGTYMNTVPGFQFRAVSWDRQPPEYVGNPDNGLGHLLSRLFNGVVRSVGLTYQSGRTKRLSFEIDVPNEMTYETLVANLHAVAREVGAKQSTATEPGRRRLLKLEEEA